MHFNAERATTLWVEDIRHDSWDDEYQLVRIAGLSGLGVLSVAAMAEARKCVRAERKAAKATPLRSVPELLAPRLAQCLLFAANLHPVPTGIYPTVRLDSHEVGKAPCFGRARKGTWTAKCLRAAWGNIQPYGLQHATKRCPGCGRAMHYWCQRKKIEPVGHWTVDHVEPHARGGCVCHFNLAALCGKCNGAKGKR